MVKENSGGIVRNRSVGEFRGNDTDKSQHRSGNRSLRQEKYRRGNQDGDSNGENPDYGTKTADVTNFEHEKTLRQCTEGLFDSN